jgi:hypothetical protein
MWSTHLNKSEIFIGLLINFPFPPDCAAFRVLTLVRCAENNQIQYSPIIKIIVKVNPLIASSWASWLRGAKRKVSRFATTLAVLAAAVAVDGKQSEETCKLVPLEVQIAWTVAFGEFIKARQRRHFICTMLFACANVMAHESRERRA